MEERNVMEGVLHINSSSNHMHIIFQAFICDCNFVRILHKNINFVGWLVGWLVGLLVGWLVCLMVGWLVSWLVGWLVGWMVG